MLFSFANRPLPDIDTLLQEWSAEVEDILSEDTLLPSDLDCDLTDYIDVACGKAKYCISYCATSIDYITLQYILNFKYFN